MSCCRAGAQSPLLGVERHRAQDFEPSVGRAGPLPACRVKPCGHVLGADVVKGHTAECGQGPDLTVVTSANWTSISSALNDESTH